MTGKAAMPTEFPQLPVMDEFPTVLGLVAIAASSSEAEFVLRFPGHYLITETIHHDDAAWRSFTTSTVQAVKRGQQRGALAVTPIVKRDQTNLYSWMITIGRTRNNDIILSDVSISKLHAWIRRKSDEAGLETFTVTDAGSRNGTFVDGTPLRGDTGALPLGSHLRLGQVELRFVDGALLFRALRRLPAASISAA